MKEKLLSLLEDVRPDVDFKSETKLIDDGILDSFDVISIVQSVGESFGVEIDVEDLEPENFNSADAILDLIEKLKK